MLLLDLLAYIVFILLQNRDIEHPYGHGKAEFISAAAEGALIIAAGFLILYETVQNFIQQSEIKQLDQGLYVVAVTAVINYAAILCKSWQKNNSLALRPVVNI